MEIGVPASTRNNLNFPTAKEEIVHVLQEWMVVYFKSLWNLTIIAFIENYIQ